MGKRPLGRPGRRWTENIGMDLAEVGIEKMNWFPLTEDRD